MRITQLALNASLASLALGAAAHAGLAFSFSDPIPGKQLMHEQGNQYGAGTGRMSYDSTAVLNLFVDGSDEANPFSYYFSNARMQMTFAVYVGSYSGSIFSAPVLGQFRIWDATSGLDIVSGVATGGAFLKLGNTSSMQLSSDTGFTYTFGSALQNLLQNSGNGASGIVDPQEATFTITDAKTASGSTAIVGAGGVVQSFTANASYSGNTTTAPIPAPGALALTGVASLAARRRRAD